MKKIRVMAILAFLGTIMLQGQGTQHYFFKGSGIFKPFLSEMRSTVINGELAWINKLDQNYYISDYTRRPFIEVHLGTDIPFHFMISDQNGLKLSTSGFIGNVLLIDMFEQVTSPIINTDYFFGVQTAFVKTINSGPIQNYGLKLTPLFHESTHLGDECSLHGYNLYSLDDHNNPAHSDHHVGLQDLHGKPVENIGDAEYNS